MLPLRACITRALAAQGRLVTAAAVAVVCQLHDVVATGTTCVVVVGGGTGGHGKEEDPPVWRTLCLALSPVLVAHMLCTGDVGQGVEEQEQGDHGVGGPGGLLGPVPGPSAATLDFVPALVAARHVLPDAGDAASARMTW
jgi:hypothetical protein